MVFTKLIAYSERTHCIDLALGASTIIFMKWNMIAIVIPAAAAAAAAAATTATTIVLTTYRGYHHVSPLQNLEDVAHMMH
jgi:hypothetical protein